MTDPLVPVRVGDCRCSQNPHADGDYVYLFPKLGLDGGFVAERAVVELAESKLPAKEEIEAKLLHIYVRFGVAEWTFLDPSGAPIPVTPQTIDELLLSDWAVSRSVADKADGLYTAAILDPLAPGLSKFLRSMPTDESTSPKNGSPVALRKRSKRSSTTTSGRERASA